MITITTWEIVADFLAPPSFFPKKTESVAWNCNVSVARILHARTKTQCSFYNEGVKGFGPCSNVYKHEITIEDDEFGDGSKAIDICLPASFLISLIFVEFIF